MAKRDRTDVVCDPEVEVTPTEIEPDPPPDPWSPVGLERVTVCAEHAYTAYTAGMAHTDKHGNSLYPWVDITPKERDAWLGAAYAVLIAP